jgi:ribosomal protein S18 acetylase RimI-like enzyme
LNLTVRVAQEKDLAELVEILSSSFNPRTGILHWLAPVMRLGIYEDLRQRLKVSTPNDSIFLVAIASPPSAPLENTLLAGTIEIAFRSTSFFPLSQRYYPYLANLAVLTEYRRQGIALHLLRACEEIAQRQGCRCLYLHVLENNYPARKLYFKAGYQLQQADPIWYRWLFNRPRKLLLRKCLS